MRCFLSASLLVAVALLCSPRSARCQEEDPMVAGKRVSEWVELLQNHKVAGQRRAALIALEIAGPAARNILSSVTGAAKNDADESNRAEAARLLGRMYDKAKDAKLNVSDAVETLADAVEKDKSLKVREAAAAALGKMGSDARQAVTALATALKAPETSLRREAAESLGRLGLDGRAAAPQLVEVLKNTKEDRLTRSFAAFALGRFGPLDAGTSVPALVAVVDDSAAPPEVRKAAAEALGSLGREGRDGAVSLGQALKDKSVDVRRAAAVALDRMGPDARPALPALKEATRDTDRAVRSQAIHALGQLGRESPDVVPVLVQALRDDKVLEVRLAAVHALGAVGPEAKAAEPALKNVIQEGQKTLRDAATDALKKIVPSSAPDKNG